jgi:serine/threonine-protein kinase ULK/ATG1
MAPEILEAKKYDAKADLWSVGTILYEMLFGKPPYMAANMLDLIHKIKQAPPKYTATSVNVNPLAIDLLKGLLQADPDKRMTFEQFYYHPYLENGESDKLLQMSKSIEEILLKPIDHVIEPSPPREKPIAEPTLHRTSSSSSSIRQPKISPFVGGTNLEYSIHSDKKDDSSFIMVDNGIPEKIRTHIMTSLSNMITMTTSGHINYSNIIFDFSQLRHGNDHKFIDQIEGKCKRSWAVAEAAYLMDKYNKQMEALCLYTRSLDLLHQTFKLLNNQPNNERMTAIAMWVRARYSELMDWAERLSLKLQNSQSSLSSSSGSGSLVAACAEDILYKYALKLAKEAAYNEYLSDQSKWQQCSAMYMRSKLVFEHLLYDAENMSKSDQQMLASYVTSFEKRIQHASSHAK